MVRGISDTVEETLPEGIGDWVDGHGRLRIWHVVRANLRRPALLVRRGRRARPAVDAGGARAAAMQRPAAPAGQGGQGGTLEIQGADDVHGQG
ncbi:MAG: hypothetical protein ACKOHI_11905 [Phycisphaerales bacterium]